MNLTPYKKRDYVKYMTFGPQKTNPIQTQFENRQNMNLTPYPENSYTPPQAPGFIPGVLPRTQTADQFKRPAKVTQTPNTAPPPRSTLPPPRLGTGPSFRPLFTENHPCPARLNSALNCAAGQVHLSLC